MPGRVSPLKRSPKLKPIYSFDIETIPGKNDFLMARIMGPTCDKIFWNKHAMADFIVKHKPLTKKAYLCATNLGFDAMGLFSGTKHQKLLEPLFRNGQMLCGTLYPDGVKQRKKRIKMIDTMNFMRASVESLGHIVGIPKLAKPLYIKEHRKPRQGEYKQIIEYNKNDTLITLKFMEWLQAEIISLGGDMKITSASTALNIFKHKYLNTTLYTEPEHVQEFIFKGYYGGRSEVLKRGFYDGSQGPLLYYDVNSMYPYVMQNIYPDVNSSRFREKGNMDIIMSYEGMSEVSLEAPGMPLPYLPFRDDKGKLFFSFGCWTANYTHFEIRKAVELGYKIKDIGPCVYYTRTHAPFREYVESLYALRMKYKQEGNISELIPKLLLNSLYGKWGERARFEQKITHMDNVPGINENHIGAQILGD